jgi:hypothetical protein
VSGETASWNGPGGLLERELLIITVDCPLGVYGEWTTGLTVLTEGYFDLHIGVLVKGAESHTALGAVKFDVFQLGKHAAAACNDSADAN